MYRDADFGAIGDLCVLLLRGMWAGKGNAQDAFFHAPTDPAADGARQCRSPTPLVNQVLGRAIGANGKIRANKIHRFFNIVEPPEKFPIPSLQMGKSLL